MREILKDIFVNEVNLKMKDPPFFKFDCGQGKPAKSSV